ncbi:hypothetical protein CW304_21985 [Bacillus sp. UFRGS-B20]|nr:hypothetical protein CW304_21985 [Bacillus sp. UFRGS-B20]
MRTAYHLEQKDIAECLCNGHSPKNSISTSVSAPARVQSDKPITSCNVCFTFVVVSIFQFELSSINFSLFHLSLHFFLKNSAI